MGHYIFNFVLATVGMIGLLYLIFVYIKLNPGIGGMASVERNKSENRLHVLSALSLEPRKRLYVVGYKTQRFLISAHLDKTELLATLETDAADLQDELAQLSYPNTPGGSTSATLVERLKASVAMVLRDRLPGTEGK